MLDFINKFNCLKASSITAKILAELKDKYEKKGIVIGLADLIIASHAKESNLVLLTSDKVFEKIDEIDKIVI
jgi:predicted nucleic acid-binding protein